ncbi:MAG: PaaI family thioesterase [Chloroflexota bacterium]|nr:MAG: PaaI family thioesterase [Chloroflexota bacterium]
MGGRRFTFEPHRCFACGELNEHGLHLILHTDATACWTELAIDEAFQGWEGVIHGGILCTILDEVMAWAVIGRDTWGVTARMAVDFKRPVRAGQAIRAEGTVIDEGRRLFRTEGRIVDLVTGELLASGTGTYVAAPPERLAELKARYRLRPADDRSIPTDAEPGTAGRGDRR